MDTLSPVKKVVKKQIPKIVPFLDPNVKNMGLENYGFVLFEGAKQQEQLACLEANGIKRYITGLNEFAPEIQNELDEEVKAAKIKTIRERVVYIERALASNTSLKID